MLFQLLVMCRDYIGGAFLACHFGPIFHFMNVDVARVLVFFSFTHKFVYTTLRVFFVLPYIAPLTHSLWKSLKMDFFVSNMPFIWSFGFRFWLLSNDHGCQRLTEFFFKLGLRKILKSWIRSLHYKKKKGISWLVYSNPLYATSLNIDVSKSATSIKSNVSIIATLLNFNSI